jgi:Protein of unknown function (DUF1573)
MIRLACSIALLMLYMPRPFTVEAQSRSLEPQFVNFGEIVITEEWQHTFRFENDGSEALEIADVQLTPPLVVTKMTVRVQPGEIGSVTVSLGKDREKGEFQGTVSVSFRNEAARPKVFEVLGKVVPPIEFDPFPMFFVSTLRNQPKTVSIEVISHVSELFEIQSVKHTSSRFTTDVQTLQAGRRYRLSLTLRGDGPAGRSSDTITLVTSSREHPLLEVYAHTNINERVHTFPDMIDFGTISTEFLRAHPEAAGSLTKELMVYQEGGKNFQITAKTDLTFLELSSFQANLKDRNELRVTMLPEKLKPGEVNGTIVIVTSDPAFRQLTIPVRAVIKN